MDYDYDVCVIGGGLAGMSAAIRTRWVKSYKALCCSTMIFEASNLGGLASWKSAVITGPSFKFIGKKLSEKLVKDVKRLNIPVEHSKVVRIDIKNNIKFITTDKGKTIKALSVIIATGFKCLCNEYKYLDKGLTVTYLGYEFMVKNISEILRRDDNKTIVVVGNEKAFNLQNIIEQNDNNKDRIKYIIDSRFKKSVPKKIKNEVFFGKVIKYFGKDKLEGVKFIKDNKLEKIMCDTVILDYNSYEIRPSFEINSLSLKRAQNGSIRINRSMATNIEGVFAAGDITGQYALAAKSIAEGIVAGFSAYKYVFLQKFNQNPPLFAYTPRDFIIPVKFKELPEFSLDLKPRIIGKTGDVVKAIDKFIGAKGIKNSVLFKREFIVRLNGKITIKKFVNSFPYMDKKYFFQLLYGLAGEKLITMHK